MADVAASVLARLKNKAAESGRSYQLCLQLFCQEEFLRRLEKSKYAENLVLKGGLFIYALTDFDSRVTMEALYFGDASVFMETVTARYGRDCAERLLAGKSSGIRMSFTFYPGINEYMGNRSVQIIITHYM